MNKKVFVSGCYDLLHSGHVEFFKQASQFGDLYVGIGSDATIFQLKARKTICSEAERLYMVKSIRYVKEAYINPGSGMMDFVETDGKTEFVKFAQAIEGVQKKMDGVRTAIGAVKTRTNVMNRRLQSVEAVRSETVEEQENSVDCS